MTWLQSLSSAVAACTFASQCGVRAVRPSKELLQQFEEEKKKLGNVLLLMDYLESLALFVDSMPHIASRRCLLSSILDLLQGIRVVAT